MRERESCSWWIGLFRLTPVECRSVLLFARIISIRTSRSFHTSFLLTFALELKRINASMIYMSISYYATWPTGYQELQQQKT